LILISAGCRWSAFQTRSSGGFIWKLLSGLYIATGVMLFVYPLTGVLTLTLLLCSFLLTGVFELLWHSGCVRNRTGRGCWVTASLLLGGMICSSGPSMRPG